MAGLGALASSTGTASTGAQESKPARSESLDTAPALGTVELAELGKVPGIAGAGGPTPGAAYAAKPSEAPPGYVPPVGELDATPSGAGVLVIVGSGIEVPPGAIHVDQIKDVRWNTLPPGSVVRVAPGTYVGTIAITANGTAEAPIRIQAAYRSQMPVVTTSLDVRGASHLRISGFDVRTVAHGGFVIRQGSHHISVTDNVIRNAPIGINITEDPGTNLVIRNNLIEDTVFSAIGVEGNGADGAMNLITRNTIRRSGHHGMEVRGSWWQIEHNDVSYSGLTMPGTSGIHIFSKTAEEDRGDHNIVIYNASYANADTGAHDGNGIQTDRWCDDNTVAFNLVWANDGAGINVYESKDNRVYANTAIGNALDPMHTHGALAEIMVGATPENNRTSGNLVMNNIAVATRSDGAAIYVDGRAFIHDNVVGPNLLFNAAGGTVVRWGDDIRADDGAGIDAATATRGNAVQRPVFVDLNHPLTGGLRLAQAPMGNGAALSGVLDFGGAPAQPSLAYFGAYFFSP
ncbi:right-handed parallel beta-helix repeat-containing protein [Variovorax robiniae]|uniref:Right-handed parallel beta-helix repeat-containing protein n=1 Tax=Variovorax robiniae TaxID=1836199 RepID=A0ABU8X7C2_9BURK